MCPKNLGCLPKFRVISNSVYTPRIWVISQNSGYLPNLGIISPNSIFIPQKNKDISQKNKVISQFWWYIPKLVVCLGVGMAVPKRGLVVQSCGLWHSFKSLARNRRAAALRLNYWVKINGTMVFTMKYGGFL